MKKARDAARLHAKLEGKGWGDDEDLDAKSWLSGQKKRQKKIEKAIKSEQELAAAKEKAEAERNYTSEDLAGIKVGHDISSFLDGDEQVLTLKDTTIKENEEEGDELEAFSVREKEKLAENIKLKKKRPVYNPFDIDEDNEQSILGQYDEEIKGKKKKLFSLNSEGNNQDLANILAAPAPKDKGHAISIDDIVEHIPSSDYLDANEIKIKKPKKKKSKSKRQTEAGDITPINEIGFLENGQMEIDSNGGPRKKRRADEDLIDDDDLQASLALQRQNALKKRKKGRPEDIARQLQEEDIFDAIKEEEPQGGLVVDDISEFVTGLKKSEEEEKESRKSKPKQDEATTEMDIDSDEEVSPVIKRESTEDAEIGHREGSAAVEVSATGVEEEKTVAQGIGATLNLLRERGLLKESDSANKNESMRQQQLFLAEKKRRLDEFEEEARRQRERDRASGKLDRMTQREREEYARQQNTYRDQQTARIMNDLFKQGFRPDVELKYVDDLGRRLNQKEAFKHLSHQFHGKGSGKGKTEKRLKKIEDEKRREAQSMLDASQHVGMSSATAQQLKKRREAGVRLD